MAETTKQLSLDVEYLLKHPKALREFVQSYQWLEHENEELKKDYEYLRKQWKHLKAEKEFLKRKLPKDPNPLQLVGSSSGPSSGRTVPKLLRSS